MSSIRSSISHPTVIAHQSCAFDNPWPPYPWPMVHFPLTCFPPSISADIGRSRFVCPLIDFSAIARFRHITATCIHRTSAHSVAYIHSKVDFNMFCLNFCCALYTSVESRPAVIACFTTCFCTVPSSYQSAWPSSSSPSHPLPPFMDFVTSFRVLQGFEVVKATMVCKLYHSDIKYMGRSYAEAKIMKKAWRGTTTGFAFKE